MTLAEQPTIALVGHCGPDSFMLRSAVSRFAPGASVVSLESPEDLEPSLDSLDVLLVNRVLDGGFRQSSGIELIQSLASRDGAPKMLLISNFDDAQSQAEAAGAMPGFGKRDLYDDASRQRLNDALQAGVGERSGG